MHAFRARSRSKRGQRKPTLESLEGRDLLTSLGVGPNVNITRAAGNQGESTISIDPTNPSRLFEADTLSSAGRYSTDGGATWTTAPLFAPLNTIGDVQTAWDDFGNLYIVRLTTRGVVVGTSTNGGASFSLLSVPALVGVGFDQPSITVGPGSTPGTGSVWIEVTNGYDQVVVTGATVTGPGAVGAWSVSAAVPGPGAFGSIAVGPSGQVLIDYQDPGAVTAPFALSVNLNPGGLGAFGFNTAVTAATSNVGPYTSIPAQPGRTIDAEANLAWDRSGGPHNGRVYMVYTDRVDPTSDSTQIEIVYSDDNGATWSAPTRVNDDPLNNGKSHFLPAIAVDQTSGDVGVTWYDTRHSDASNATTEVFGTVSTDGGATWLPNVQISAGASSGWLANPTFNYGDYDLMDFSHGVMYRTWADNSNSTGDNPDGTASLDIYTAAVTVVNPVPTADLSVAMTGPSTSVWEGDSVVYTITARNDGPATADGVVALGQFSAGLAITGVSTSQGTSLQMGGTILISLGSLAPGQVATATITGTAVEEGTLTNVVTLASTTLDANATNNATSITTPIAEPPINVSRPIKLDDKNVRNQKVATFTHGSGSESANEFVATIDWGDGTTSTGTITQSGSNYLVQGSHKYARNGEYRVTTSVSEREPAAASAGLTATPTIAPSGMGAMLAAAINQRVSDGLRSDPGLVIDPSLSDQLAINLALFQEAGGLASAGRRKA